MRKLLIVALLILALAAVALGKTHRSAKVRRQFIITHPCPSTGKTSGKCPGYVVDHIKALACGGPDAPSNMQWQSIRDAKAKDRWERKGCEVRR